MYTGYFAQLKKYIDNGLIPISICGKAPDWYRGFQFKTLAPKWEFFNEWKYGSHKGDNNFYVKHFNEEVLESLNPLETIIKLENLTHNKESNLILICYEKPSDFCHRHLVADWFNINGFNCKEFEV